MAGLDPSTLPNKAGASTSNPYLLLGLQLGSLGLSAGQSIAARRRLQQLRQPIRPQVTRNPLLSQRLAQAQQEAQLGNDLLRREREASTAMALERGRQVASQMGGATYGAMMQNQIAAADRGRRSGLVEDEQLRMQRQGQLDNLIGQQMNEDARLDQMAMQGFGMDMQLYNQRLMMEEANQRQANQNIVGTAAAIGADSGQTFGQMGNPIRRDARKIYRRNMPLTENIKFQERMQMPMDVPSMYGRIPMESFVPFNR